MKNLRRAIVIGFAAGGMTLFGAAAASADTYHYEEKAWASPEGGGYSGWKDHIGKGGWKKGKASFAKWGAVASQDSAVTWVKKAASK